MMSTIYYGIIREDKKISWNQNRDPYKILEHNIEINRLGGWKFLDLSKKLFYGEVQVDWGSFAYKCRKQQLVELSRITNCEIPYLNELKEQQEYGIIFIEEY